MTRTSFSTTVTGAGKDGPGTCSWCSNVPELRPAGEDAVAKHSFGEHFGRHSRRDRLVGKGTTCPRLELGLEACNAGSLRFRHACWRTCDYFLENERNDAKETDPGLAFEAMFRQRRRVGARGQRAVPPRHSRHLSATMPEKIVKTGR